MTRIYKGELEGAGARLEWDLTPRALRGERSEDFCAVYGAKVLASLWEMSRKDLPWQG